MPLRLITVVLLALACAPAVAEPTTMEFVKDGAPVSVAYLAKPWTTVDGAMQAVGVSELSQRLLGRCVIGPGDFTLTARLALIKLASSAAVFSLGASDYFGFAGGHGKVFLSGPLFNKPPGTPIGEPTDFMTEGQPFDFVVSRAGDRLRFTIDGKLVHEQPVGPQALGAPGFVPYRATIRLLAFAATGNLLPYKEPAMPAATRPNIVLDPRVQAVPGLPQGPFVRLKDGSLFTIENQDALTSRDEGKTWQRRRLFGPDDKTVIRPERGLIRTHTGTLVLIYLDDAQNHYSWDKAKNLPLPDMKLPAYAIRSADEGQTWTDRFTLTDGWCGCDQDIIETCEGTLVVPSQELRFDQGRHTTVPYFTRDDGQTWTRTDRMLDIAGQGDHAGAIEATLEQLRDGSIWLLLRTPLGRFYESRSTDGGQTWSEAKPSALEATSAPGKLKRLASGRLALLWNAPPRPPYKTREELSLSFSEDDGTTWTAPQTVATNVGQRLSYLHMFERAPGELWVTTMQGGLRVVLHEAAFLKRLPTVVAFGDSTTAPRDKLGVYADLVRQPLFEQGRPAQTINAGLGGNNTAEALARFQKDVLDRKPAVVVIQFGINDQAVDVWRDPPATVSRVPLDQYRQNLVTMLDQLRTPGIQAVLMTPNPLAWTDPLRKMYGKPPYDPANPDGFNVLLRQYAAVVRELAAARQVPLVDVFAAFEEAAKQTPGGLSDLLLDGMHPNQEGQRLVAARLGKCLAEVVPAPVP